jgi:hypothetical protein
MKACSFPSDLGKKEVLVGKPAGKVSLGNLKKLLDNIGSCKHMYSPV